MSFFSTFFNRGLQEKGQKMMNDHAKCMEDSNGVLKEAISAWIAGDDASVKEKVEKITQIERNADKIKDEYIEQILSKRAYMRQSTEENYFLIQAIDKVITEIEETALILATQKRRPKTVPSHIKKIAEATNECTDHLEDAIKLYRSDYKEARQHTRVIENLREEARHQYYEMFKMLMEGQYAIEEVFYLDRLTLELLEVALKVEEVADYIRALTVKYG